MLKINFLLTILLAFAGCGISNPLPMPSSLDTKFNINTTISSSYVSVSNPVVHAYMGQNVSYFFTLHIPLINQFVNVQELDCFACNAYNNTCHSTDVYPCATYKMRVAFYWYGPKCMFIDTIGLPYTINAGPGPDRTNFQFGSELLLLACCGDECQYKSPLGSPPAWYLQNRQNLPEHMPINDEAVTTAKTLSGEDSAAADGMSLEDMFNV